MATPTIAGDATNWDEDAYRSSILLDRQLRSRTVFRAAFAGSQTLAVAASDGSIAAYSIPNCIAAHAKPLSILQAHNGPAYDLNFYGDDGEDTILFSCGDDGHIRGWRWIDMVGLNDPMDTEGSPLKAILDLANPQHEGPWGARSPMPENNAIAISKQEGSIYAAAGDACAYCWDVETGKIKIVFKGHTDYLHCVVASKLSNQIITGSEDGTARIWDCRSGKCTKVIYPETGCKLNEPSWVSSVAIDSSESWLACGSGKGLSVWSLLTSERIFNIDSQAPVQDVLFDDNQILAVGSEPLLTRYNISGKILSQIQCAPRSTFSISLHPSGITAVGGYGGVVDVISEYGSHLCIFCCRGAGEEHNL